jgi:uncharacterized protein YycO
MSFNLRYRAAGRSLICVLGLLAAPAWAQFASEQTTAIPPAACRPDQPPVLPDTATMESELQDYQQLAEQALSSRARAIAFYEQLKTKIARGEALSGQDLRLLNQGAADLIEQRQALLDHAFAHECWVYAPPPADRQAADIQRTGVVLSLSAALILYDNYLSAISLYRDDPVLRKHLNHADSAFKLRAGELNRIAAMFSSPENRGRVRRGVVWYQLYARDAQAGFQGYPYLVQSVEQSPSYRMVQETHPLKELGHQFEVFRSVALDTLFGIKDESTYVSSLVFGNAVGLVETRRGKLDQQPQVAAAIAGRLRAGDILLEKTPFRLTDNFIPGHWGHAAVWVGSETELRELGIWDHPVVRPYQAAIREGRGIVEALRSGVEMNNVPHFLNIDDLAILRQDNLAAGPRAEVILQALRQVGKEYDFNFDAETTQRVFCSKLVYLAYGDLQWPTTRFLGKVTISPDNIAERAIGDGPLEVAVLYHDGHEISDNRRQAMANLLAGEKLASMASSGPSATH